MRWIAKLVMLVKLGLKAKKKHVPHSKIWYQNFPLFLYILLWKYPTILFSVRYSGSCEHSCWFLRSTTWWFSRSVEKIMIFFIWGKMDSSFRTFKNPHVQLWRRLKPFQSCWIWTVIFFCIYSPQLPGRLFSPSDISKKLSHHFLLHFPIGMGSYDHHAKYQGVFMDLK